MEKSYVVREFRENDDFDYFDRLVWDENTKRGERLGIKLNGKYSVDINKKIVKKENYFPESETQTLISKQSKGLVLEVDGVIAAVVTVTLHQGGNGNLHMLGCVESNKTELEPLIKACVDFIQENGGNKLYCFSEILPGQIRNQEIDFWEKYSFIPEPYYSQWVVCHDFRK
jgi:hypothetical protein